MTSNNDKLDEEIAKMREAFWILAIIILLVVCIAILVFSYFMWAGGVITP